LTRVQAGWYECYNFKGTIDKYPITLSIQVIDDYFGKNDKNDFNIIGVYKYDNYNNPIRLEGKINFKDNKALLYEISNSNYSATFEFDFSETECDGIWRNLSTNKTMPLHLNYVSQLVDTVEENKSANIEILQANSLRDFYLVGIYFKTAGEESAHMDKLQIIKKKDKIIFQTIDFSTIESKTGNVATIIYDNVEVEDLGENKLNVQNYIGRRGGYLTLTFNSQTRKFKLDPKLEIDGPN
jgi:hypothetical protein